MNSPQLLSADEKCRRLGFWSLDWERGKIDLHELLQAGIHEGMITTREDRGNAAGERIMEISASREIVSDQHDLYSQIIHYCAISDIVSTAVRKATEPPWGIPEPVELPNGLAWNSGAFLAPDGLSLRRIVLATSWSDNRHYSEARSWFSLGEVCCLNLPMKEAVIILGAHRDGKRHGYWSKGLRHPVNKKLRFRKKTDVSVGFKSTWATIFREDYDEISTEEWLSAMLNDGVLPDVCFSVEIPTPERKARQEIVDLAARRLDEMYETKELPSKQLSTCDHPYPCDHRVHCHKGDEPSGRYGFVRVDQLT